ncbi:MAG: lysophospholipid acyltransferase family protein [Chthoniobacterales bacterium]
MPSSNKPHPVAKNTAQTYFKSNWKDRYLPKIAVAILKTLLFTVRLRLDGPRAVTKNWPQSGVIITFWHNRILAITKTFFLHYPATRKGVSVLTSPSRDGEILARIMHGCGMGAIRGSTNKRGTIALRECRRHLESGADLAVTPDGPRGPKYKLGPGLILLAQQTGAKILPCHVHFSRAIRFKTWDGFCVPLPFSRIDVTLGEFQTIAQTETAEDFEKERLRIETLLKNETDSVSCEQ